MSKAQPTKLKVEPIIEAIAELRFKLPSSAGIAVGPIYAELGKEFPEMRQLPPASVPREERLSIEGLAAAPLYQFMAANSTVLLGDRSVAYSIRSYNGWENFKSSALSVFRHVVEKANPDIDRVSVRYVNFLRGDAREALLKKTTLSISFGELQAEQKVVHLRTELSYKDALVVVHVISNAETMVSPPEVLSGLVVDVDAIVTGKFDWVDVSGALDAAHTAEKDVFFSLIADEALQEFGPMYD